VLLLVGLWSQEALASHAGGTNSLTQQNTDGTSLPTGGTTNSTGARLRGTSDGSTCGCGPYYLEYEVRQTNQGWTGNVTHTSPPTQNNNCSASVYQWTYLNNLSSGTYKWRVREYTSCSNQRAGWTYFGEPAFTIGSSSVNTAPSANAQSVSTNEDNNLAITLTGSDPEGDSLTYVLMSAPSNGFLTGLPPNVTYSPQANWNGSDSFNFLVSDGSLNSGQATVSITVNAVNDAPSANSQSVITNEDSPEVIFVVASDPEGSTLTYSITDDVDNGTLVGSGPSYLYTPHPDFYGGDSFEFKANDGSLDSNAATVYISVRSSNDPPQAGAANISTDEDSNLSFALSGSDADGDSLTWHIVTQPSAGSLTLDGSAPNYTYAPNPDYNGADSFTFKVNDGTVDSNIAPVNITINPLNDAPLAVAQSVATTEDVSVGITLVVTDVDGDSITYSIVSHPTNGSLSGTGASLTYTPGANFTGSDSFTFKGNDGTVDSNAATVSISVSAVNDPPVASNQAVSTSEDVDKTITVVATDSEGDLLSYTIVTSPTNGTLTASPAPPTYKYDPDPNFTGLDSFTFKANDGTSDSNTATVTISVGATNDAPVASNSSVSTAEDTAVGATLVASDADGDSLTYTVLSGPSNGALSGVGAVRTYTPDLNFTGSDSFDFKVNDGTVDSNTATVTISINSSNDAPVAISQSVTTNEDVSASITLSGADNEGDPLTYTIVTQPSDGTLTVNGAAPNYTYTPGLNFNGSDLFTFKVSDGTTDSNTANVTLTVTAVNDAPVASNQSAATTEDTAVGISLVASDVDADPLTYSNVSLPTDGTLSGTGSSRTYTPDLNFNGSDQFTWKANDGALDSTTVTVTITVGATNDAPVASNQSITINEDTATLLSLSASDTDAVTLSYSIVVAPSSGTLSGSGANRTYTPDLNSNGIDSFTWKANDGLLDSNVATYTVTVSAVNDAPIADAQAVQVVEDTPTAVMLTGSDVDADALTYVIVTAPSQGTVTGVGAGRTYTPNLDFTGSDSFTFKVNDGNLDATAATVSITVVPVSDPPTADPLSLTTDEDVAIAVTLTGADGDGDALTFSVLAGPFNGTLSGTPPNLTYTPNLHYNGTDLLSYQAHDGTFASASAPVSFVINAINDAPVALNQSVTTGEDETLPIVLTGTDVEGTALTFSLLGTPAHGTLSGTAPNLVYSPDVNFFGSDSFTFRVDDGQLISNTATISIAVSDINDLPAASAGGPYTVDEGSPLALDGTGCTDVDGNVMTWMWDCESDGVIDVMATSGSGDTCTYAEDGSYTLKLVVVDDDGEQSTQSAAVTVNNVAPIITSMVTPGGVEGFMLQFGASATDPGPDTFTFHWDFGNGSTPATGDTQHTYYPDDGVYTVTLTVTDDDGDSTVQTSQVVITNANPTILTLTGDTSGDEGTALSWSALAADPGNDTLVYSWAFGDGGQATGPSPVHAYVDEGVYTVTLTVTEEDGGSVTDSLAVTIANVAPTVTTLAGDSAGDEGELLSWSAAASDPGADLLSFHWDFGDGSPSAVGASVSHIYLDEGSYPVTVTVTDGDGGSASETMTVNVSNVAPVVLLSGDEIGVEGDLLGWTVLVSDVGVADTFSYQWDFGDGSATVAGTTPGEVHSFGNQGTYVVTVTVTDNGGASSSDSVTVTVSNAAPVLVSMSVPGGNEGQALTFSSSATDIGGDTLLYTWDFGDGSPLALGATVTHSYGDDGTYVVTVTVDDGDGGTASQSDDSVIGNVAPVVDSLLGPTSGLEGQLLEWSAVASDAGVDDVLSYQWDFGDGSSGSGAIASHSYSADGLYTVTVVVSDDDGASSSASIAIEILNAAPVVSSVSSVGGLEGTAVVLTALAVDPGSDTLSYTWNFGDGSLLATGATQTHVYEDDGIFTLTVTVDDGDGGVAVGTGTATIANVAPEITLVAAPSSGDEGELLLYEVLVTDAGLGDLPQLVTSWDFGDGTAIETGTSVLHPFPDDGVFTITVTVDDQDGGIDSETLVATIANVDPEVLSSPPGYASEGVLYNYELVILDPGAEDFTLALSPSSPAAMTADSAETRINWTPTYADTLVGAAVVTVTVDDGDGGSTVQSWTIQVGFADDDGDGLADQWELEHGLDPSLADDAVSDPDGDGLSNLQEFLDGTDPNSFDGPDEPVAVSPLSGDEVDSATPFLVWENAFDPQLDELTYHIQVWADEAMTQPLADEDLLAENDWYESSWKVEVPLAENSTVWWRVRAFDGLAYGAFSELQGFFVNTAGEAPDAPVPVSPLDGDIVASPEPQVVWVLSADPDLDEVRYEVQVLDGPQETVLTEALELSDSSWEVNGSWTLDIALAEDTWYAWQVRAVDADGQESDWSVAQSFYYSLENAAPYDVVMLWPLSDDLVESLSPALEASEGVDPEEQELQYRFELDLVATFDSESLLVTEVSGDGSGTVTWDLAAEDIVLAENEWLFARVRGTDPGGVSSQWDTVTFMVHGENEVPPTPELVSPDDGMEVETSRPTLVAWNVEDPEDDMVFYEFVVSRDAELSEYEARMVGVLVGTGSGAEGQTAWTVNLDLLGEYYWGVRAIDEWGGQSEWSEVRYLRVGRAGEPEVGDTSPAGCSCESSIAASHGDRVPALLLLLMLAPLVRRRRECV